MKHMIFLLLLCYLPVAAQEARPQELRPGWTALRRQGNDFLMSFYRLPQVEEACKKTAEVTVPFDGPGHELTIDCKARRSLLVIAVGFYRSPEVAKACAPNPQAKVTVTGFGMEIPVDCAVRTSDLALIEPWLR